MKGDSMPISDKDYDKLSKKHSPPSPLIKDCIKAFIFGGLICLAGEAFFYIFTRADADEKTARTLVSLTFIAVTAILTAIGVFDKIAKHAGAGTFVPITGFANAVVSAAMEHTGEGKIMGVGTQIFSIAGPVILYGTAAGVVYGIIYWIFTKAVA